MDRLQRMGRQVPMRMLLASANSVHAANILGCCLTMLAWGSSGASNFDQVGCVLPAADTKDISTICLFISMGLALFLLADVGDDKRECCCLTLAGLIANVASCWLTMTTAGAF